MKIVQIDIDMPKNCFDCGLKFRGTCPRLIKSVQGLRKERLEECPLKEVEAIPQADYENRLKADMVAMLTDMLIDVEEIASREQWCDYANDNCISRYDVEDLIQKKIKALKENTDGTTSD